jgi:hypothetical protein
MYYVSTGAAGSIDVSQNAAANGVLTYTIGATDNVACTMSAVAPSMRMRSGKKFFMTARFKVDVVTAGSTILNAELFIGATSLNATGAHTDIFNAGGTAVVADDHVGWICLDPGASLYHGMTENDVGTITDTGLDVTDNEWIDVGMYYDGTDVELFQKQPAPSGNDVMHTIGKYTPTAIPVSVIGPTVSMKTGEAKARTLYVDYLFIACER